MRYSLSVAVLPFLLFIGCASQPVAQPEAPATETAPAATAPAEPQKAVATLAKYNQIENGMTLQEVETIMGGPGTELSSNEIAGITTAMYQWDGESFSNMNVTIQNGEVMGKAQFNLK